MPLIEEAPNDILKNLQDKFLQFNKDFEEILEYYNNLTTLSRKEYDRIVTAK